MLALALYVLCSFIFFLLAIWLSVQDDDVTLIMLVVFFFLAFIPIINVIMGFHCISEIMWRMGNGDIKSPVIFKRRTK